jgi:hypothetical protein
LKCSFTRENPCVDPNFETITRQLSARQGARRRQATAERAWGRIVVHAIDANAKAFCKDLDFEAMALDPMILAVTLKTLQHVVKGVKGFWRRMQLWNIPGRSVQCQ